MKGLALSKAFYLQQVKPILHLAMPGLRYGAALLGPGSDVLGYDDDVSQDHDWGPRVRLFVEPDAQNAVSAALDQGLPEAFMGYPVWYGRSENGVATNLANAVNTDRFHLVTVEDWAQYRMSILGPLPQGDMDWLRYPEQRLLELTAGEVFRDDSGALTWERKALAYYPRNVWLYRLGAALHAYREEANFCGRAGDVGDRIGSRIIGARLTWRAMRIGFLLCRTYMPYAKWFGAAFHRLPIAKRMETACMEVLEANNWRMRVRALGDLEGMLLKGFDDLGLGERIGRGPAPYRNDYWNHDLSGPNRVIEALIQPPLDALEPSLGALPDWLDNTPVQGSVDRVRNELGRMLGIRIGDEL